MHPTIVMSNAVHVYVSQAHKGDGYGQRGAFHIIERQMAAAVELFPVFARAHLLRTWAGIVDVCPDASPIVGRTPYENLYLNAGWGTGGFKVAPGLRGASRTRSPTTNRTPTSPRSAWTASSPARWSTSTPPPASRTDTGGFTVQLIECPWCGPREETEFHYGGQAHVVYPPDPQALTDEQWAHYVFYRDNPKGLFAEWWSHAAGCLRWFNAVRDTATYRFHRVYRMDEQRPTIS